LGLIAGLFISRVSHHTDSARVLDLILGAAGRLPAPSRSVHSGSHTVRHGPSPPPWERQRARLLCWPLTAPSFTGPERADLSFHKTQSPFRLTTHGQWRQRRVVAWIRRPVRRRIPTRRGPLP